MVASPAGVSLEEDPAVRHPLRRVVAGRVGGDNFQSNSINTLDNAGSLRVQRIGSTVYAYVRGVGEPWNLIFTGGPQTGEGIPQMTFSANGDAFGHQDGSVAYDNFHINSGALTARAGGRTSHPTQANPNRPGAAPRRPAIRVRNERQRASRGAPAMERRTGIRAGG